MPPQTMRSQSTQPMQQMQPMQSMQARQAQARPRASGDVTTDPTPGTPRGDLLALLIPDFTTLPPDSLLSDATVTTMLADDPAVTRMKMHDAFCRPPGPLYCEAEKTAWVALHPWCNSAMIALTPPPMFTDEVTRSAWMALHSTCPTPPPVLSDHVCTPGEPGCGPVATTEAKTPWGWIAAGVLGVGWWMYESGKQARKNPRDTVGLFYLQREPLDRGGYTSSGRYFGVGAPLYRWSVEWPGGGYDEDYVRGATREAAMKKIREKHPGAKFVNK